MAPRRRRATHHPRLPHKPKPNLLHRTASSEHGDVENVRSGGEAPSITSATEADALMHSQTLISVFEVAMEPLKGVGAQAVVAHMASEIQKERRRARAIGKEEPDVLFALARHWGSRRGPGTKAEAPFVRRQEEGADSSNAQ